MSLTLHGIFPPMLTPFDARGDIDEGAFIRNIERWNRANLSGYVVLGSNSEAVYLAEKEKLQLIELALDHAAGGRSVIAGTGLESTRETIALTNLAASLGAQAALVITPSFYGGHMTEEALVHHFTSIADESKIPILLYNVPKFTHINLTPEVVQKLSEHSNIVGMKDSKGDVTQLEQYARAAKPGFQVVVGTASVILAGLKLGCRTSISALANVLPNECAQLMTLYEQGKETEAERLQMKLIPLNSAVTQTYGVAGLKYAASLRGYEGGEVRSPLLPLSEQERVEIRKLLAAFAA